MFGKIYGGGDFALKSKTFFKLRLHFLNSGEMQEWFNWHAWKACVPQKGTGGSNPPLSATPNYSRSLLRDFYFTSGRAMFT